MISYSINRQVKNKPHKNQMHTLNNKFERMQGSMSDLLQEIIKGNAFCIADLEETKSGFCHRESNSFLSCQIIAIDIDNSDIFFDVDDGSFEELDEEGVTIESGIDISRQGKVIKCNIRLEDENYWTLDQIKEHSFVKNYASFIYTSFSHKEDHHRYRIVFELPEKIYDPKKITQILKYFQKMFDPASDRNCVSSVQAFYGSQGCQTIWFGNQLNETIINNIAVEEEARKVEEYKVKFNRNDNVKISEQEVITMLNYIPDTEYLDWVRIISAVASEFDEEATIRIIEKWRPGTPGEVKQKYDKRLTDISIGTLIWMAKQNPTYVPPASLYKNKEKRVTPPRTELLEFLQKYAQWRRNVMKNKIIVYKPYLTDEWIQVETEHINSMLVLIEEYTNFKVNKTLLEEVIDTTNLSENFHPLKSYFEDLRWDYNDRFKELAECLSPTMKYLGSDDDKITQIDIEVFFEYGKELFGLWFRSAYACAVYGTPNELMIILQGKQGVGKTRFCKAIYPPGLDTSYFYAGGVVDNKDTLSRLSKKFFYVDDEMEGMKKTDINFFKSLLSQAQVTLREVYGKRDTTSNRTASFLGSVNKEEFLKDEENRRFPVLAISSVNFKKLNDIDIQMLWAQAKEQFESGLFPNYASDQMRNAINKFNDKHYMQNDVAYYIDKYIGKPRKGDSKMQCQTMHVTAIRDYIIQAHKLETGIVLSNQTLNIQWVKQELERLNYNSVNHSNKIVYKVKVSPLDSYKKIEDELFNGRLVKANSFN